MLTDIWAYGAALGARALPGQPDRLVRRWYRGSDGGNPYAHHVTGLHPVVDLNAMELLEIEEAGRRRRRRAPR